MNFLKISGLVIGTGSVVGGAGVGIYFVTNNKTQFNGKLVFSKKNDSSKTLYEARLLNQEEYDSQIKTFDKDITDNNKKYEQINKIIDISHLINISYTKNKLNNMFGMQTSFGEIKTKISSSSKELKELFDDEIYKKIEDKFKDIT